MLAVIRLAVLMLFEAAAAAGVAIALLACVVVVPQQPRWLTRIGVVGFVLSCASIGVLGGARAWVMSRGKDRAAKRLAARFLRFSNFAGLAAALFLLLIVIAFLTGMVQ